MMIVTRAKRTRTKKAMAMTMTMTINYQSIPSAPDVFPINDENYYAVLSCVDILGDMAIQMHIDSIIILTP